MTGWVLAGRHTGNGREVLVDEPCGHRAIAGPNKVPEGLHDKFLVCFCWAGVIGLMVTTCWVVGPSPEEDMVYPGRLFLVQISILTLLQIKHPASP